MPMMAVYEQNDARSSARLLATTTLRELEARDDGGAAIEETVALNMFRLLEDYRAHQFYGLEDEAPNEDEFIQTSMLPSGERHMADLRIALDRTIRSSGLSLDATIDEVEMVLRFLAYPDLGATNPEAIERAKSFLSSLIHNLQFATI